MHDRLLRTGFLTLGAASALACASQPASNTSAAGDVAAPAATPERPPAAAAGAMPSSSATARGLVPGRWPVGVTSTLADNQTEMTFLAEVTGSGDQTRITMIQEQSSGRSAVKFQLADVQTEGDALSFRIPLIFDLENVTCRLTPAASGRLEGKCSAPREGEIGRIWFMQPKR